MINLLPPDIKENVVYARRNTKLLRWLIVVLLGVVGIGVVVFFGELYLSQSTKTYNVRVDEAREQLKVQKIDETQARVREISGSLKLVGQVLSKEILFSKLLRQIGAAIPSGAVLTDLTINQVEGGIDLRFEAKDYQTGTQIQLNLQDATNKIFDKADIEEIRCQEESDDNQIYACEVTIRALFGDNNPYLFINSTPSGGTVPNEQ